MLKKLKRFILVDGNALVHRAYHALPPLTTKKGEIVNAVYGFTTLLLRAIADIKPDYAAVAFDLAGPTFRHEAYKEYKATRVKGPDDLYAQFDRVKEVVQTLNIPIFGVQGYEADDVIGTLSKQAAQKGIETIIVTGDMDTLQLVNGLVKVYTMRRGITDTIMYDSQAVIDRYGLTPAQFVDFKALKGDASDNIPGVSGIGEKTAASLIQGFGSLDQLYAWLAKNEKDDATLREAPVKITPRVRDILLSGQKQAYDSRHLSQIVCDIPIELDLRSAALTDYDRAKAAALFQELEFHSLLPRLPETAGPAEQAANDQQPSLFDESANNVISTKVADADYLCVTKKVELNRLVKQLSKAKVYAIDTETDYLKGPIIGLSFALSEGSARYVPVDQVQGLARQEVFSALRPVLTDATIEKVGHNMKYDYLALRKDDITLAGLTFDTMIASYLLNSSNRQHNLDAVAFVELGVEKIPLEELIGVKKLDSLAGVEVEKVAQYACEDADIAFKLYRRFAPRISDNELKKIFYQIEMPLVSILAHMEERGIQIDTKYLQDFSVRLTKRVQELRAQIYKEAGEEFNINSPSQLSVILFDKLQLTHPDLKKTKTGVSTAASELAKLRGLHPIVELMFEYRELTKLLSTYIDVLPTMVDKQSRLHTSFNQTVAATGRLSSSDPNLQNIPVRTEIGKEIRQAFVAGKGNKLISADYSQIELRVVAHLSGDPGLLAAFKAGRDIHQEVADTLGVERRVGKTLNFAVLYGQGPYSTAQFLGISVQQAKTYIETYFQTYGQVRQLLDSFLRQAREQGYVETVFGRRRYIPEILSSNFTVRSAAERMAANHPLQGTAADIMKMAMIAIAHSDLEQKYGAKMLLQVHDELILESPLERAAEAAASIKEYMENVYQLDAPLVAETAVGNSWGDL